MVNLRPAQKPKTQQLQTRLKATPHPRYGFCCGASLRALGPKIVCITDGPQGAYMSAPEGNYFMPPYPDPKPPVNRTGAGDAFAATFVSYLARGFSSLEALRRAPINSAFVVQEIGAQKGLLTRERLEEYLTTAPKDFSPRPL